MHHRMSTLPASTISSSRIWIALLAMTVLLVSCPGGGGGY
jgi:hypothetical protein